MSGARTGFVDALAARDLEAVADLLADDVVMHSPVLSAPFSGRRAALDVYAALFEAFGEMEIVDRFATGDGEGFRWYVVAHGSRIEGADFIRTDASGRVDEVHVLIRPLPDIATFAATLGPVLARRTSARRARVVGAASAPLRTILRVADRVACRLTPQARRPVGSGQHPANPR